MSTWLVMFSMADQANQPWPYLSSNGMYHWMRNYTFARWPTLLVDVSHSSINLSPYVGMQMHLHITKIRCNDGTPTYLYEFENLYNYPCIKQHFLDFVQWYCATPSHSDYFHFERLRLLWSCKTLDGRWLQPYIINIQISSWDDNAYT